MIVGEASALHGYGRGCLMLCDTAGAKLDLSAALDLYRDLQNPFGVALSSHGMEEPAWLNRT